LYAGYSEIILRVFSIILFPITLAIHPRVTKLWNDDKKRESLALVRKGIWIQSGIFLLSFIIFYVFESQFFELSLFLIPDLNSDFKSLGIPLLISGFLWQVSLLIHKPLELKENPIKMVWAIVFALAVAIIGNGIFLPKLGVIATAYSSIASASVYILMIIFFMMKANQFNK
jgi:O-antigen/teichoic acid export membrane protein